MKIALYSPYLDTAGGGEKYMLTIAEILSHDCEVDVLLDQHLSSFGIAKIKERIEKLHKLDLSKISFIQAPVGVGSSILPRLFFLKNYDWLIYNTDGSVFYSTAKNSLLHFQIPLKNTLQGLWGRFKLNSWRGAIYNSVFTKDYIEKEWNILGNVLYPPINTTDFFSSAKKKQILSVGRFDGSLKVKKQGEMIEVFKELSKMPEMTGWSFHLAGGAGNGDLEYLAQLQHQAQGFPIVFYPNLPFDKLTQLYSESVIYWHAMGLGENDPKLFEHFGITTVEAMTSGCVPIVINLGGQKEIVQNELNGFLWDNIDELKKYTLTVVEDTALQKKLAIHAQARATEFSKDKFKKSLESIIYDRT